LINGQLADAESLARGISCAFAETGNGAGRVVVLEREPAIYASSFPAEIVTCRTDGGPPLRLRCKYPSSRARSRLGAPRGGPACEALVYRHLLRRNSLTTVRFFGT
jgi:hypothetical protein